MKSMKSKLIAVIMAISVLSVTFIQPALSEPSNIHWSEIHETGFKAMTINLWKADKTFTFNISEINVFAIRIITNQTPPSRNVSITLKDSNGTMVFHKEIVDLTDDEINNGIWHIEYLTEPKDVIINESYKFELTINRITRADTENTMTAFDNVNYMFGSMETVSSPTEPPSITFSSDQPTETTNETEQTALDWAFDNIGLIIFLVIAGLILFSLAKKNGRKRR
jgi:hypothetical protein